MTGDIESQTRLAQQMESTSAQYTLKRQPRTKHRPFRLIVPPAIFCALAVSMTTLLLTDLRQLSEDDLALLALIVNTQARHYGSQGAMDFGGWL